METQAIINFVLGTSLAALGWFARELWDAVKELKVDLSKLKEDLPRFYVAKEDYRRDVDELKDICRQIFAKLDHKVDK